MSGNYTYEQSIALLESLYHRPILPAREVGLDRIGFLLQALDNPERTFRSVHVAGSTGKGSTTAMIGGILQAAGFRTGHFFSPHLYEYTERIGINGTAVSREEWERSFNRVWPLVKQMSENALPGYSWGRPALFEVLFAMMAECFAREGVEWAAVETGLGGRHDATNTLLSDVAVVTNVSLEHTQVLGDTVRAIAGEKAAIIKPGADAVTAARDKAALDVVRARCQEVGALLLEVGHDVRASIVEEDMHCQKLVLRGPGLASTVSLSLAGAFQAENAATAFAAALSLRQRGVGVPAAAIVTGLESVRVPGRFEVAGRDPLIILDGAHNPAGAERLAADLERLAPARRVVLVVAAMRDKDLSNMARHLGPLAHLTIVTRAPGTERAASGPELADAFARWTDRAITELDAGRALDRAIAEAGTDGVVVVTGSLYLVGHVRAALARTRVAP